MPSTWPMPCRRSAPSALRRGEERGLGLPPGHTFSVGSGAYRQSGCGSPGHVEAASTGGPRKPLTRARTPVKTDPGQRRLGHPEDGMAGMPHHPGAGLDQPLDSHGCCRRTRSPPGQTPLITFHIRMGKCFVCGRSASLILIPESQLPALRHVPNDQDDRPPWRGAE